MSPILKIIYFTKLPSHRLTQIQAGTNKLFARCFVLGNDILRRVYSFGSLKHKNNAINFDCARGVLPMGWFESTKAIA